jgi:hypothetical protein
MRHGEPETRTLRDPRRWSYAPCGILLAFASKRPIHRWHNDAARQEESIPSIEFLKDGSYSFLRTSNGLLCNGEIRCCLQCYGSSEPLLWRSRLTQGRSRPGVSAWRTARFHVLDAAWNEHS